MFEPLFHVVALRNFLCCAEQEWENIKVVKFAYKYPVYFIFTFVFGQSIVTEVVFKLMESMNSIHFMDVVTK